MIFHFVDIGGIDGHRCLDFFFSTGMHHIVTKLYTLPFAKPNYLYNV